MLDILKRIQTDVSTLRSDVSDVKVRLGGLETRMDKLEALVRKQGRDSAAMLVMMRGTVGIYDERLKVIEEDVRLLMEHE
jgi:N-methylhydantoinase B/oxoprolinase/acetone carboxylase alpha subunit